MTCVQLHRDLGQDEVYYFSGKRRKRQIPPHSEIRCRYAEIRQIILKYAFKKMEGDEQLLVLEMILFQSADSRG
jgi:fido (protein-threonine AMPylation protein)